MISICSEALVRICYTPEGFQDLKWRNLTAKDKCFFGIPEKLAYLDIIAGITLLIIGALSEHNTIGLSGRSYPIGFGIAQCSLGLTFKLLSFCCPCLGLGEERWAGKLQLQIQQNDGSWIDYEESK